MKKLKKIVCLIFGIAASLICLSSCGQNDVKAIKIALYGADDSETWNVWAWKELGDKDENYDSKGWPGGSFQLTNTDENGCKYTSMMIDTTCDLGILFVSSTGNKQTSDINVPKSVCSQQIRCISLSQLWHTTQILVKCLEFSLLQSVRQPEM